MKLKVLWIAGLMIAATAGQSQAGFFSFTGSFTQDDEVQLFNFDVSATSNVTLKTLSYAGGINAAGDVIAAGGFDPILALFDSSGFLIDTNDDGSSPDVGIDPITLSTFDTYLLATLGPGTYTVAISQYNNFAVGPLLSDGFDRAGAGNFTGTEYGNPSQAGLAFIDVNQDQRTSSWAFDVLNVETASAQSVPEPASLAMWSLGGLGMMFARRKRQQKKLSV